MIDIRVAKLMVYCYRGGEDGGRKCTGPLSGWSLALSHHRHRLRHASPPARHGRGLQIGEGGQTHHLTQPQLHGPAAGAGARVASRVQATTLESPGRRAHRFGLQCLVYDSWPDLTRLGPPSSQSSSTNISIDTTRLLQSIRLTIPLSAFCLGRNFFQLKNIVVKKSIL